MIYDIIPLKSKVQQLNVFQYPIVHIFSFAVNNSTILVIFQNAEINYNNNSKSNKRLLTNIKEDPK